MTMDTAVERTGPIGTLILITDDEMRDILTHIAGAGDRELFDRLHDRWTSLRYGTRSGPEGERLTRRPQEGSVSAAQPSRRSTKQTTAAWPSECAPKPEPQRTPRWASPSESADYAGVCTKTIYRWIAAGELTAYRAGKRLLRLDLHDVDALMRRGELS